MKAIRWTIWILLTFVVIATLDSQPDPPAVNPGAALCKILPGADCSCIPAARLCETLAASVPALPHPAAADACQPCHPADHLLLTVHASDPSPPALLA
jgi:hypothetical protein